MNHVLIFAVGLGIVAGLRSLTAPAVVAWAAHLGWLNLSGSRLAFMASTAAAIVFSICAIAELIVDKLPMTPKRTAPVGLLARVATGALCGAALCVAGGQSLAIGLVLGGIGAVIGAFGGYQIRSTLLSKLGIKDVFIAICEDVIAIALACLLVKV